MRSDWRKATLGDCASLVRYNVSPADAGDVPYIGLEHIGENSLALVGHGHASDVTSTKARFKQGDILFGKLRPYFRKVVRAPFDGICSTDIWVIRAKEGVDQRFLFYCFANQPVVDFATAASEGTRMPRAKWDYVEKYELGLPPLAEQRRIAHILGALDDKIELNRRMNATLEGMARALFKSWFVDFEPVRAKMEGRWRRGESLPGMPAELWDAFPSRLVATELGDAPEGWEVKKIGEILESKTVRVGELDVPEYSSTNEGLVLRSEMFKKRLSASNAKNKVIYKGDLVFGLSRRVLNFGLMQNEIGCVSPAYRTYSVNRDVVLPDLLERIMRLRSEYYYLAVSASSREGQSISQEALYNLNVCLPDIFIQERLNGIIQSFLSRASHLSSEINALVNLRDALLPGLVSGECGGVIRLTHD